MRYLDSDNADIREEGDKVRIYNEDKLFTGVLVYTYSTKQAVKQLLEFKKGKFTGIQSHHGGDRTMGSIKLISGETIIVSKTLKYLENLLKSHGFYRIHQSFLTNINYIENYSRLDGGTVKMQGGDTLQVSRANKKGFESFISYYGN